MVFDIFYEAFFSWAVTSKGENFSKF